MRDIILTGIIFGLLPYALRNPVFGIYGWVWLSMMNPHRAVYGFARGIPFAHMVAVVTLLSLLMSRHRKPLPVNSITVTLIVLVLWMSMTSFFAIADSATVLDRWVFVMKSQIMVFATLMLVRGRQHIDWLVWVIVGSVGFYGVKGGIWTVLTGGGGRVWGPPGLLEGNNELAVALVAMVPLMYYMYQTATRKWVRTGMVFSMVTTSFAILGSQSRGALLAIVAMALFLGLKSKRPVMMTMLTLTAMLLAVAFMPDSWTQRMDSIQSYSADNSAMSRIYTWRTLFNCALDRPLTGAGFAADNAAVFSRYAPQGQEYAAFDGLVFVAHSIYLQMLGEHGFPGLMLYLALAVVTWRKAGKLAKATAQDAEFGAWVPLLMPAIQVSLIGFAVGGAFLSLAYLDVPYYIVALVVLVDASWKSHCAARERAPLPATGAAMLAR